MTRIDPDQHASAPPRAAGAGAELPHRATVAELQAALLAAGVATAPHQTRGELLAAWIAHRLATGHEVVGEGALDLLPEGFGFVRSPHFAYEASPHDPFVTPSQVRALNLKAGHWLAGPLRAPRGNERFFAMTRIERVNGAGADQLGQRVVFAARTPVLATRPLAFDGDDPALRVLAQLAPWCHGQRVLVVAPPSWPRARWLADAAHALRAAANTRVFVCLLDQRPEDLAAASAAADAPRCEVTGTTFDQPPERQLALAELVLARVMREVEAGRDAVLLFDSLTALTHAAQRALPASGRWLCPNLDAQAVLPGKRVFAAARACAEGGSLTVIATASAGEEPGGVDHAVLAELAHRGNSEVVVDGALAAAGAPAPFDARATRTRPEDDDRDAATLAAVHALRDRLAAATTPAQRAHVLATLPPA